MAKSRSLHVFKHLLVIAFVFALVGACDAQKEPRDGSVATAQPEAVAGSAATQDPVADTAYGPVRGVLEDGILTFKGIRYGADTSTTRFAAPARPASWTEVQDGSRFGATCPQTPTGNPGGLFTSWRPDPEPPMDEDCLFLNVWTPALDDGGNRPVLVWFHGGGFTSGSGSSRAYDGVRLARRGDVVVVTVNHRLNVFGYLALGHYGDRFRGLRRRRTAGHGPGARVGERQRPQFWGRSEQCHDLR